VVNAAANTGRTSRRYHVGLLADEHPAMHEVHSNQQERHVQT